MVHHQIGRVHHAEDEEGQATPSHPRQHDGDGGRHGDEFREATELPRPRRSTTAPRAIRRQLSHSASGLYKYCIDIAFRLMCQRCQYLMMLRALYGESNGRKADVQHPRRSIAMSE